MEWFIRLRGIVVAIYLVACCLVLGIMGLEVGTELFPQIDQGEFVLALPAAARFQLRADARDGAEVSARDRARGGAATISRSRWALSVRSPPISASTTWCSSCAGRTTAGCASNSRKIAASSSTSFASGSGRCFPSAIIPWLADRLEQGGGSSGVTKEEAQDRAEKCTFGFEPGDIISQVMSFGESKPIAVRLIGTDYDLVRAHAEKIAAALKRNPHLRDVGFDQTLDYPTVEVNFDRELAGLIGITPRALEAGARHGDVVDSLYQPQLLDQRQDGF